MAPGTTRGQASAGPHPSAHGLISCHPRSFWTGEASMGTVRNAVGSRGAQDEKEAMRGLERRREDAGKRGDTKSRAFTGKLRNVGRTAVAAHKPTRGERRRFRASIPRAKEDSV